MFRRALTAILLVGLIVAAGVGINGMIDRDEEPNPWSMIDGATLQSIETSSGSPLLIPVALPTHPADSDASAQRHDPFLITAGSGGTTLLSQYSADPWGADGVIAYIVQEPEENKSRACAEGATRIERALETDQLTICFLMGEPSAETLEYWRRADFTADQSAVSWL